MLRVNSDNVLIVPPFEAAWLTDQRLQLEDGKGCVEFEVKGEPGFACCRSTRLHLTSVVRVLQAL